MMQTLPGKIAPGGFGETIGVIVAKLWYPALIRGHHNHAATYDFPIRIKLIENWVYPQDREKEIPAWNTQE